MQLDILDSGLAPFLFAFVCVLWRFLDGLLLKVVEDAELELLVIAGV
jgi:hypothetical protein